MCLNGPASSANVLDHQNTTQTPSATPFVLETIKTSLLEYLFNGSLGGRPLLNLLARREASDMHRGTLGDGTLSTQEFVDGMKRRILLDICLEIVMFLSLHVLIDRCCLRNQH